MEKEGKYIYCIIGTNQERNFGPSGIGDRGDDVLTIGYDSLSMVVSNHPVTKLVVNRENMLAHERVIEEVMKEFTVLPVRFGTIAVSADEIRNLLDRRYMEFKNLLRDMDHKVELGVKALWKDMKCIFGEIVDENEDISRCRGEIRNESGSVNVKARMEIGTMVQSALEMKKEKESGRLLDVLRRISFDHRLNRTVGDEMFMNASFLVTKGREKEFDTIMDDLSEAERDRTRFLYAGPLPAYNFVNLVIYPEEWEK